MKVQRVCLSESANQQPAYSWLLLDDEFLIVKPVHEFLVYLTNLERSPNTIRAYAHHLKLFWQFLNAKLYDWKKLSLSGLAEFVGWLREPLPGLLSLQPLPAKRSESTVNTILAAVSNFYEYQYRLGAVAQLPLYTSQTFHQPRYKDFLYHISKSKPLTTRRIKLKAPRNMPQTLTAQQVQQVLAACHTIRDRFLIALLYQTGMRIGQALGLRHCDIHSWDNTIQIVANRYNVNQVRAKTRTSYIVDVSSNLMELYTRYLLDEFDESDSDYVFVNLWEGQIGQPLRYGSVITLFRRLSKRVGLAVHPHLLRHTHATELIQAGWQPAYVQKRLGHAQVQTTLNTYVHLNDADLKKAYVSYLERKEASSL
jgi:integrase/recombinase XerD